MAVALASEDFSQTGMGVDPSTRQNTYGMFGVKPRMIQDDTGDPMDHIPPAALAEQQLAEFRAAMSGGAETGLG